MLLPDSDKTLFRLVDLVANLQWLHLLILITGIIFSLRKSKRYLWTIVLIPLPWLTAHDSAPEMPSATPAIKVISTNVNFKNTDLASLKTLINSEQPDMLVLLELSPDQARQLANLQDYPFQQINPDNSPFGIGELSKLPFAGQGI